MKAATRRVAMIALALLLLSFTVTSAVGPYDSGNSGILDGQATPQYWPAPPATSVYVDSSNGGSGCTQHNGTIYMQWTGLNAISRSIGTATITLTPNFAIDGTDGATLALYKASNQTLPPTAGYGIPVEPALSTFPVPSGFTSSPSAVVFPSSATFVSYLESARIGSGVATFIIRFSACAASADIDFTPIGKLNLLDTTAVTLRTFRAADGGGRAANWPLIAGGLLFAALAVGVGIYRWRVSAVQSR